jgi:hypothetical protein
MLRIAPGRSALVNRTSTMPDNERQKFISPPPDDAETVNTSADYELFRIHSLQFQAVSAYTKGTVAHFYPSFLSTVFGDPGVMLDQDTSLPQYLNQRLAG